MRRTVTEGWHTLAHGAARESGPYNERLPSAHSARRSPRRERLERCLAIVRDTHFGSEVPKQHFQGVRCVLIVVHDEHADAGANARSGSD